jgi:RNA polymerase sigma factor (sigma-70 family)
VATEQEISDFLKEVERRAFKQALYVIHKDESALDIVQDSMIKLVERYSHKPITELPMLFQRILQNTILDYLRREKVKNSKITLFSNLFEKSDENNDNDLNSYLDFLNEENIPPPSSEQLERTQMLQLIDQQIQKLPPRQREAFLMRYWEDMDVAQTANIMKCSEGSVKTHCSRAAHTLAESLKALGIEL